MSEVKTVKIFTAEDSIQAEMLLDTLKNNGVPAYKQAAGPGGFMTVYGGNAKSGEEIYVAEENEEKAMEILTDIGLFQEMKEIQYAFLIMGDYDSKDDQVEFADGRTRMIGVSDLEDACKVARRLQKSGIDCIELCGAFGEDGARAIIEATEHQVAVGFVTHFPEQDDLFRKVFGE
ncbi:MAG: DUF6506 family protein [Lachnospiraceae bacterium]